METGQVMIHVRFSPDGTVVEISERPGLYTPQQWYNYLCDNVSDRYQPLSGGRGVFRLTREQLDMFKTRVAA